MIGNLKDYLNNRVSLLKLEVIEGTSKGLAQTTSILLLTVFFLLTYFFLMFGLSWYIGEHFLENNLPLGFIISGLIHLGIALLLLIFRKRLVEKPILNFLIRAAFNTKNKNHED